MALEPLAIKITADPAQVKAGFAAAQQSAASFGSQVSAISSRSADAWSPAIADLKKLQGAANEATIAAQETAKQQNHAAVIAAQAWRSASDSDKASAAQAMQAQRTAAREAQDAYRQAADYERSLARQTATVQADAAKQAASAYKSAAQQEEQAAQGASAATDEVGNSLSALKNHALLSMAAGVVGTNLFTNKIINVAQEANTARAKLDAMFKVRGQGQFLGQVREGIEALSKQTGKDSDEFSDAAAHLNSFGLSAQQIAQILPGIEGQSETMGQDLNEVADEFGRAFASGNIGALARTGTVLSEADKKAIKYAQSISETAGQQELFNRVLNSYQNFAVQAGSGITDAAKKTGYFKDVFKDMTVNVGQGAQDMEADWEGAFTPLLVYLNKSAPGLEHFAGGMIEIGRDAVSLGAPILGAIRLWKEWELARAIGALASAKATAVDTAALEKNTVALGLNAAAAGTDAAAVAAEGDADAAAAVKSGLFSKAGSLLKGAGGSIVGMLGSIGGALGGAATAVGGALATAGEVLGGTVAGAGAGVIGAVTAGAVGVSSLVGAGLCKVGQHTGLIDPTESFGERMATGFGRARDALTGNSGAWDRRVQGEAAQHMAQVATDNKAAAAASKKAAAVGAATAAPATAAAAATSPDGSDAAAADTMAASNADAQSIDKQAALSSSAEMAADRRDAVSGAHADESIVGSDTQTKVDALQSALDLRKDQQQTQLEADLHAVRELVKHGQLDKDAGDSRMQALRDANEHLGDAEQEATDAQIDNLKGEAAMAKARAAAAVATGADKANILRAAAAEVDRWNALARDAMQRSNLARSDYNDDKSTVATDTVGMFRHWVSRTVTGNNGMFDPYANSGQQQQVYQAVPAGRTAAGDHKFTIQITVPRSPLERAVAR